MCTNTIEENVQIIDPSPGELGSEECVWYSCGMMVYRGETMSRRA